MPIYASIGLPPISSGIVNAQVDRAADAAAQAENATRSATTSVVYRTTGVGYIVVPNPVALDVRFTQEPIFTSGVSLIQPPSAQWQYPQVTAGVYRWERERDGAYVGAYMYFVVKCEPNPLAGTNRDAIADLSGKIAALNDERTAVQNGAPAYRSVQTLTQLIGQLHDNVTRLDDADNAEPETAANPVLAHHLSFEGIAMKELSEVQAQLSDGWVEPRTSSIGFSVAGA